MLEIGKAMGHLVNRSTHVRKYEEWTDDEEVNIIEMGVRRGENPLGLVLCRFFFSSVDVEHTIEAITAHLFSCWAIQIAQIVAFSPGCTKMCTLLKTVRLTSCVINGRKQPVDELHNVELVESGSEMDSSFSDKYRDCP